MILWSKTKESENRKGVCKMRKMYMAECWYCNEPVMKPAKNTDVRTYHEDCFKLYMQEKEETNQEYAKLKIEVMFERALRMMEKQGHIRVDDYKEAAEAVHELALRDTTKFDSSHEMIAVMELINNKIKVKVQYRVNRRKIDVLIPELKVALEIDGHLHKFRIGKDSERDIEILNELNKESAGWEVIRIPTKYIEKRVDKLIPAIKALYSEKQKLRAENGGYIPSYYSRHNQSNQLKALEGIYDKSKYTLTNDDSSAL